jgi:hypothetical protein
MAGDGSCDNPEVGRGGGRKGKKKRGGHIAIINSAYKTNSVT